MISIGRINYNNYYFCKNDESLYSKTKYGIVTMMNKNMYDIPKIVQEEFRTLIEMFGNNVHLLGERDGVEFYIYDFSDDVDVGFPLIVSIFNGKITRVEGFDAVRLVASFRLEN